MTNDATYREKGRAVILAALMVLSVVAMSAAFAGGAAAKNPAAANYDSGPTFTDGTIDKVWIGQEITLDGVGSEGNHDGFVSIAEGPDATESPDTVVTREADTGSVTLPTENLEEDGIYHIHVHGDTADNSTFHGEAFRAQTENLDVEFTRDTVTQDSTGSIEVSSDRGTQYLNVSSDSFDASDLRKMFSSAEATDVDNDDEDVVTLEVSDDTEYNVDFSDIDQGSYDFDFDVTDSQGSDNASVEVVDSRLDYSFEDVDSVEQGGVANITLDVGQGDSAAVTLGSVEDGYATHVELENIQDEQVVLQFDTHDVHDNPWSVHSSSDAEIANHSVYNSTNFVEGDAFPDYNWDLSVGDEMEADTPDEEDNENYNLANEHDRDRLVVSDRAEIGDTTTETAPAGDTLQNLDDYEDTTVTDTNTIAEDDHLIVNVENFGAEGLVEDVADRTDGNLSDVLSDEGIYVELSEQSSGPINDAQVWNSSSDAENQLTLTGISVDEYSGNLIFTVDVPADLETGTTYDFAYKVTPGNTYVSADDGATVQESTLTLEDREVAWDDISSLPATEDATATGTTTVAPGTELPAEADSPNDQGSFVQVTDALVTAGDDGNHQFAAEFDLSEESPGVTFDLYVEDPQDSNVNDELTGVNLTESDGESDSTITVEGDAPSSVEVNESATLDVTVTNNADSAQTVDYHVDIGDETVDNQSLELEAGEEFTESYDIDTSAEGDISWGAYAGDATDEGTVSVSADNGTDDSGTEDSGSDDSGTEDSGSDDSGTEDSGSDDGDDDGTPGFGVGVALVALLGAAMLALRRQN